VNFTWRKFDAIVDTDHLCAAVISNFAANYEAARRMSKAFYFAYMYRMHVVQYRYARVNIATCIA